LFTWQCGALQVEEDSSGGDGTPQAQRRRAGVGRRGHVKPLTSRDPPLDITAIGTQVPAQDVEMIKNREEMLALCIAFLKYVSTSALYSIMFI
jgi:hypothetical protein